MLRNGRQLPLLLASPLLAVLALALLWAMLPLERAMAQAPQPQPPAPPDIFLVDGDIVAPAGAGNNDIGLHARLTVGRLADKPEHVNLQEFCPPSKSVEAAADDDIFYCYRLENTGDQTLLQHTLVDSRFGEIFNSEVQTATPGQVVGTYRIGKAIVSNTDYMTWTATTENGEPLTDFSQATVIVPALDLTVTAGLDPAICAAPGRLMMERAGDAVFCLQLHNPNAFALKEHRAFDASGSEITLPPDLVLEPGATFFVTTTAQVTQPTFSQFMWTAKSVTRSTPHTVTNGIEVRTPHISTVLLATVATLADCASNTLTVTVGSQVLYCYYVVNDGSIPLSSHIVTDSVFGRVGDAIVTLLPDDTYGFGITRTLTTTTESSGFWQATGAGGITVEATTTATVIVVMPARLDVRVYVDDGTPPSGSNGLPGVVVEVTDPAGIVRQQRSDEYGTATFLNLIPGTYKVEVIDTSALKEISPLTGALTTTAVIEGATVGVQFPFTGTIPPRQQHLPLVQR